MEDDLSDISATWQSDGRGLGAQPPANAAPLEPAYGPADTGTTDVDPPQNYPPPSGSGGGGGATATVTMRAIVVDESGTPTASTQTVVVPAS